MHKKVLCAFEPTTPQAESNIPSNSSLYHSSTPQTTARETPKALYCPAPEHYLHLLETSAHLSFPQIPQAARSSFLETLPIHGSVPFLSALISPLPSRRKSYAISL